MFDTTEIGIVAAKVMEDVEDIEREGDVYGENPRIVAALVVYEIRDDDGNSTVGCRVTEDRNVLAAGLLARAQVAVLHPDGESFG